MNVKFNSKAILNYYDATTFNGYTQTGSSSSINLKGWEIPACSIIDNECYVAIVFIVYGVVKVDNLLLLVVQILSAVNLLPRLSQGCDHLIAWLLQGGKTIGSRYKAMAGILFTLQI